MTGERRRFLAVTLAALVAALLTARLGVWQLDRAAQKIALQQAIESRGAAPPLPQSALARTAAEAQPQHYRRVQLHGRWISAGTVYLDNRQMQGRPGFYVVTPLRLAQGDAVLVQRGWLPRDAADRTRIAPYRTPEGEVDIAGRIAPPPSRLFEFEGAASGPIRQNLDPGALARDLGVPLRPLSILQLDGGSDHTAGSPADGLLRDWPQPAVDVQRHYGYAFQWFALSALVTALYVWFQLVRPRRIGRPRR